VGIRIRIDNKSIIFSPHFFADYVFNAGTFTSAFNQTQQVPKKSQTVIIKVFLYLFAFDERIQM
jgi:hypothetical protein